MKKSTFKDKLKKFKNGKNLSKYNYPNVGKFVIIDLRIMDYMKDEEKRIVYYDTFEEAELICGMYEFKNAWVLKLMYNHKETADLFNYKNLFNYKKLKK